MHVIARVHRIAARAWLALAAGAGLGFIARDLLDLPAALVATVWIVGALVGLFRIGRS
jgi:hypothetical protein